MERFVTVNSFEELPCSCDDAAPVYLCVATALVGETACEGSDDTYAYNFVEATLDYMSTAAGTDCRTIYKYVVKYDDSVLVSYDDEAQSATEPLTTTDVTGIFCRSCLTDFVEQSNGLPVSLVGDGEGNIVLTNQYGCEYTIALDFSLVLTVADTQSIDLTLDGSEISADAKVSATANNRLQSTAGGLYVSPVAVSDSNTVDLAFVNAGPNQTLFADVNISGTAGNVLTDDAGGLYVPTPTPYTVADTPTVDMTLSSNEISADVSLSGETGNILSEEADGLMCDGVNDTNDTNSIELTKADNVLSADLIVSPQAGNIISVVADGVYASGAITVVDSDAIDLSYTAGELSADLLLSADGDNCLTIESDGLKSDAINSVTDTNSVDLTKTDNDLSADVKISATGGNILQENGDGLYVPGAAAVGVDDTTTIDLTLTGGTVTGDVILSADADNALSVESDGLKATVVVTGDSTATADVTVTDNDEIAVDVNVSADAGNMLDTHGDGLHVDIQDILEAIFPVGTIWVSRSSTNPASYAVPYPGTWELHSPGKTVICVDSGDSTANSAGEVSGFETVNLAHQHQTVFGFDGSNLFWYPGDLPSTSPRFGSIVVTVNNRYALPYLDIEPPDSAVQSGAGGARFAKTETSLGATSVRQPSIAEYRWHRTA